MTRGGGIVAFVDLSLREAASLFQLLLSLLPLLLLAQLPSRCLLPFPSWPGHAGPIAMQAALFSQGLELLTPLLAVRLPRCFVGKVGARTVWQYSRRELQARR